MGFPPRLAALLLCFAAGGVGAAPASGAIGIDHGAIGIDHGVSSSTSSSSTSSSTSTGSTSGASTAGTTSCSVNANGRRCEATCVAPKVAHCTKAAAQRTPRCACR